MPDASQKTLKKPRVSIPKAVSETVLNEFSHKCAVCGRARPQLHHIDEDPSNSVPENLVPLCPNHHLLDIHDPTRKPDPLKIRLFRRSRDPFVLDPRFEPIWKRLKFVWADQKNKGYPYAYLAKDLCSFIKSFKMGDYYSNRLEVQFSDHSTFFTYDRMALGLPWKVEDGFTKEDVTAALVFHHAESVENLCVEMIRYQDWVLSKALVDPER